MSSSVEHDIHFHCYYTSPCKVEERLDNKIRNYGNYGYCLTILNCPLAHVILVEDMTEDFNIDSTDTYDTNYATATWSQNGFLTTIESDGQNNTTDTYHYWEGDDAIAGEPSWSATYLTLLPI